MGDRCVTLSGATTRTPADDVVTTEYAFVIREVTGEVRYAAETHISGLFAEATWLRLLGEAGFEAEAVREVTGDERVPRTFFVGRRRAS